jgi:chromosome segregation ATPase
MDVRFLSLGGDGQKVLRRWFERHVRAGNPVLNLVAEDTVIDVGVTALQSVLNRLPDKGSSIPPELELAKTKKTLDRLQKESRATTIELKRGLESTRSALAAAQQKNKELAQELDEATRGRESTGRQLVEAEAERKRLASALEANRIEFARVEQRLGTELGASTEQQEKIRRLEAALLEVRSQHRSRRGPQIGGRPTSATRNNRVDAAPGRETR